MMCLYVNTCVSILTWSGTKAFMWQSMTSGAAKASEAFGQNTIMRCEIIIAFSHRSLSHHDHCQVHGFIFVVDSSDQERLQECSSVLTDLLNHPQVDILFLFFFVFSYRSSPPILKLTQIIITDVHIWQGEGKTNPAPMQQGWCGSSPGKTVVPSDDSDLKQQ